MTAQERIIVDFSQKIAKPCRLHNQAPTLTWDGGCWAIDCPHGCSMHSGPDEAQPFTIIQRYQKRPL